MSRPIYPVPPEFAADARVDAAALASLRHEAETHPDAFWKREMYRLDWMTVPTRIDESSFDEADFAVRWFADGELNVSVNCIDRHLATRGDQTALVFEGDEPGEGRTISYRELHEEVCRFANVLKAEGVAKGDRVTIYMPMIPEAAFAMLACAIRTDCTLCCSPSPVGCAPRRMLILAGMASPGSTIVVDAREVGTAASWRVSVAKRLPYLPLSGLPAETSRSFTRMKGSPRMPTSDAIMTAHKHQCASGRTPNA